MTHRAVGNRFGQRAEAFVEGACPRLCRDGVEVDNLPAPLAMRAGDSWTANLALPPPPPLRATEMALSLREQQALLRRELQRMAHHEREPQFLQR